MDTRYKGRERGKMVHAYSSKDLEGILVSSNLKPVNGDCAIEFKKIVASNHIARCFFYIPSVF